jgi:cytidine deaminase
MSQKEIHLTFNQLDHPAQLEGGDKALFEKAAEVMVHAYAPYSRFKVGAAVLLENGIIVQGSNQENMAYPSGLCAERVALFSASAIHPGVKVIAVAVAADPINKQAMVSPCGACRQVIMEYQQLFKQPIRIITGSINGIVTIIDDAATLMPLAFFDSGLQNNQIGSEGKC